MPYDYDIYGYDYEWRPYMRPRSRRMEREAGYGYVYGGRPAYHPYDYGFGYRGMGERGWERGRWPSAGARLPRKPAYGYPVRGYHTYDLDYGSQAGGPTTEYSGRAGYPTPEERVYEPRERGPYTPRLADIGRLARRWRALYGETPPEYRGRWRGSSRRW